MKVGIVENRKRYRHPSAFMIKYPKSASKKAPRDQAKVIPSTNLLLR